MALRFLASPEQRTSYILHHQTPLIGSPLSVPCEAVVKSVAPALRAMLAKKLIDSYSLKQQETANLLGITQAAISKYVGRVRGKALELESVPGIQALTDKVADGLVNGRIARPQLVRALCEACTLVRRNGLVCSFCRRRDRSLKDCSICRTSDFNCGFSV